LTLHASNPSLDNQRIFNARDKLDWPCTPIAGRDINIKHSLESLRPSHFLCSFTGGLASLLLFKALLTGAFATLLPVLH
jgi:hypothetical protein